MTIMVITDKEFELFQQLIYNTAGINMAVSKKSLVNGRLAKRVKFFELDSFTEYFELLSRPNSDELQVAIDLLTTNETFFFREAKHFDFLQEKIVPSLRNQSLRVWSAASSSGEEAYTVAMVLAAHRLNPNWEVVGTDISTRMVNKANQGQYPIERAEKIPLHYLKKYGLKGTGAENGSFIFDSSLSSKVSFMHANLRSDLSKLGRFDVIFLRNVLIYFNLEIKQQVVDRVLRQLKPGGYLMISHTESLNELTSDLIQVAPSIYHKKA